MGEKRQIILIELQIIHKDTPLSRKYLNSPRTMGELDLATCFQKIGKSKTPHRNYKVHAKPLVVRSKMRKLKKI